MTRRGVMLAGMMAWQVRGITRAFFIGLARGVCRAGRGGQTLENPYRLHRCETSLDFVSEPREI